MDREPRTQEADLIEDLRTAHQPKLTQTAAAKKAGITESRWRQVVSGFQPAAAGAPKVRVIAPAQTIARMSYAVGATPEQLVVAGRPDAADELRHMLASTTQGQQLAAVETLPSPEEMAHQVREHVGAILALPISLTDSHRTELHAILTEIDHLPDVFGSLLDLPLGRDQYRRNCLRLLKQATSVLTHYTNATMNVAAPEGSTP